MEIPVKTFPSGLAKRKGVACPIKKPTKKHAKQTKHWKNKILILEAPVRNITKSMMQKDGLFILAEATCMI